MRDIEFRGKLINSKEWAYGNLCVKKNGVAIITPDDTPLGKYGAVDPETVGQYTGLKDKNGTKIYEGDIVKFGVDKAVVIYSKENTGYILKPIGDYYFDSPILAHNIYLILEVIGNIVDNKELLEE